ncbi:MAG: hypothetical protein M5R38_13210 [Candidatus Methylomirabilis sp.]|nr:hypothetical protein [Candidatus Methylomirabilis sp.]
MIRIIGWDIGGANVKAARLLCADGRAESGRAVRRHFELWHNSNSLHSLLQTIYAELGPTDAMVVTMTGELCDAFADRAEGVAFIINAVRAAVPDIPLYAIDLDGRLMCLDTGEVELLTLAPTNWIAEAMVLATRQPDCLMMDIGSTTTDLIPIMGGRPIARGKRDIERLAHGELIYTGALRTPVAAIASGIPVRGVICRISAEYFAISADVYLALGQAHLGRLYLRSARRGRENERGGAASAGQSSLRRQQAPHSERASHYGRLYRRTADPTDYGGDVSGPLQDRERSPFPCRTGGDRRLPGGDLRKTTGPYSV